MARVAAISAGPRSASPRGSRARSFCGFLGFSAIGGVGTSAGAVRQPCLLSLLPLWEKVARTQSASDEGSASAERTPHPPSLREGTLSHTGRGEEGLLTSANLVRSRR